MTVRSLGCRTDLPFSRFDGVVEGRGDHHAVRAIVAARARDAAAFGARYLLVDALPASLPILLSLGVLKAADTWPCDWEPAAP